MQYGFGVDIGGTTVKLGCFDTDGRLYDQWEIPTNTEKGGEKILPDIAAAVKNHIARCGAEVSSLIGVGLGVPGPVTADGVVNKCVNLGWDVTPVASELSSLTGLPVRVGNDANVAALGEMWQGGGKGYENVVMVTLGTGVGGGVIVGGQIVPGAHGAGGEIGHLTMRHDETEPCGCGKHGCLEQYASATGIVRMARRRLAASEEKTALRGVEKLTAKDVFDCARDGDGTALSIVDDFGAVLGLALAQIACVCDPEIFVIGGGVSKAGQIVIDAVQKHYKKYAFHASRDTRFALAALDNSAGIYGSFRQLL